MIQIALFIKTILQEQKFVNLVFLLVKLVKEVIKTNVLNAYLLT